MVYYNILYNVLQNVLLRVPIFRFYNWEQKVLNNVLIIPRCLGYISQCGVLTV